MGGSHGRVLMVNALLMGEKCWMLMATMKTQTILLASSIQLIVLHSIHSCHVEIIIWWLHRNVFPTSTAVSQIVLFLISASAQDGLHFCIGGNLQHKLKLFPKLKPLAHKVHTIQNIS